MQYQSPYIAILDVGHGNATVLRDEKEIIVIDCGAKSAGLLNFLEKEQITQINKLFISHADQDHIGGLIGVISTGKISIDEIFCNSDGTKGSDIWDDLVFQLDELHESGDLKFTLGISKSKVPIKCGSISIEVVGPSPYLVAKGAGGKDDKKRMINSNSLSASFKIVWNDISMVFLAGDIDQIGLDDIMRHGVNINSNVLVYPHHGGRAGSADQAHFTNNLYDIVNPETVIFSIGRNKFQNPKPEIVNIIKQKNKGVRVVCTQLSRHCMEKIKFKNATHLVDLFSVGRENHFCCSGTFVVKLDEKISHHPAKDIHEEFIKKTVDTPLCL